MDGSIASNTGEAPIEPVGAAPWWIWSGWGFPRSLDDVRFRDIAAVIAVALTVWAYVDIGPHGRIEPGRVDRHKTDFTVYTEAGAAFFDGRDPYRVANPRGWYYLYPPLFALLVSPLTAFDTETQTVTWYIISALFAFGCYGECRRLARWTSQARSTAPGAKGVPRDPWLWIGVSAGLAVLLPTLDCLQRGQLGIAILYFLMLGLRLVLDGRSWPAWFLGGVVLALPASIKFIPLLPVGFLLLQCWSAAIWAQRPGRPLTQAAAVTAGCAVGGLLFVLVIPAACVGWTKNIEYLHTWTARVVTNRKLGPDSNFDVHSPRNQSFANAVHLWTATPPHPRAAPRSLRAPSGWGP